jgi:hypothetical protein
VVSDLVVLPHCDLHVSLANAPQLRLQVFSRRDGANPGDPYILGDITSACQFDFFAPDLAVGHRFDNLPTVAPATGLVTATTPGRYLFQVRFTTGVAPNQATRSIVGSLQVHADVLASLAVVSRDRHQTDRYRLRYRGFVSAQLDAPGRRRGRSQARHDRG